MSAPNLPACIAELRTAPITPRPPDEDWSGMIARTAQASVACATDEETTDMQLATHLGYGTFHLEWFQPGEMFVRYDGSLARVCRRKPQSHLNPTPSYLLLPDHIQVWFHPGTSNAMKVYLHRHAIVQAVTAEQARLVQSPIHQPQPEEIHDRRL